MVDKMMRSAIRGEDGTAKSMRGTNDGTTFVKDMKLVTCGEVVIPAGGRVHIGSSVIVGDDEKNMVDTRYSWRGLIVITYKEALRMDDVVVTIMQGNARRMATDGTYRVFRAVADDLGMKKMPNQNGIYFEVPLIGNLTMLRIQNNSATDFTIRDIQYKLL